MGVVAAHHPVGLEPTLDPEAPQRPTRPDGAQGHDAQDHQAQPDHDGDPEEAPEDHEEPAEERSEVELAGAVHGRDGGILGLVGAVVGVGRDVAREGAPRPEAHPARSRPASTGTGTSPITPARRASAVAPWRALSRSTRIRWAKTAGAIARMSSGRTKSRPSR